MSWDWILSALIIGGLILAFWARLTKQTIGDIFRDIRDFIVETKENAAERGEDLIYYE